jgi:hypothetical protein
MHVIDSLSRGQVPLSGKRMFRFPFVVSKAEEYLIPPVRFSYFNPVTKKYIALETRPLQLVVGMPANRNEPVRAKEVIHDSNKKNNWLVTGSIIFFSLSFFILLFWLVFYRKKTIKSPSTLVNLPNQTIEEKLKPLYALSGKEGRLFYIELKQIIWNYTSEQFNLKGSALNRMVLSQKMKEAGISQPVMRDLSEILDLCEIYIYNEIDAYQETEAMMEKTVNTMKNIDEHFRKE